MDFSFHRFVHLFSDPTSTLNTHKTLHQGVSQLSYLLREEAFAKIVLNFAMGLLGFTPCPAVLHRE